MNKNTAVITLVSLAIIFGFLLLVYKLTSTPPTQTPIPKEIQTVSSSDHLKWSPEKKNILLEYSDLQCPACKAFHDVIKAQIEATPSGGVDITKKITFVYRHFPLEQHQFAKDAAYAAEAAGKQSKFFEMVDLLFNKQDEWSKSKDPKEDFVKLAQQLNLNIDNFKKDIESEEIKKKVEQDFTSGLQAQVRATPTFLLNGKKLDNIKSFDEFKKLLQSTK